MINELGIMPPQARAIIEQIASLRGVQPLMITNPCRIKKVYRARVEVSKLLDARGYTSPQIGRILNHDHTTILFYLGKITNRKPKPPVWRAPKVRTLLVIKPEAPPRPTRRYLTPYAGADWREYQWKEIRT